MPTSMKEHLVEMHKRLAKHHEAVSGHCQDLADCMGKASTDEGAKGKGSLEELSGEHVAMAEFHDSCAAKCAKAALSELNRVVPSNISGIAPDVPANTRAVPRYGAPLQQCPTVPLEFERMFSTEDGA
jgi:hypothetical protein